MGLIHIILALILRPIVAIISVPYTIIKLLFTGRFGELLNWFHQLAFMLDLFGNYLIKYIGSDYLLSKNSNYLYGRNVKTISHVTAFNYYNNTTSWLGSQFSKFLILCNDISFKEEDRKKPFLYRLKEAWFLSTIIICFLLSIILLIHIF